MSAQPPIPPHDDDPLPEPASAAPSGSEAHPEGGLDEGIGRLERIAARDGRYHLDAWRLTLEALGEACGERRERGEDPNVGGGDLCHRVREIAGRRFGYLARLVLERWGVRVTEDFGEMVWRLVDDGLLQRRPSDRKEDFAGVYDFSEAFEGTYLHA